MGRKKAGKSSVPAKTTEGDVQVAGKLKEEEKLNETQTPSSKASADKEGSASENRVLEKAEELSSSVSENHNAGGLKFEVSEKAETGDKPVAVMSSVEKVEASTESVQSNGESNQVQKETVEAAENNGEFGEDLPLYPVPVKGPGGEEVELQVNPVDTVMDLRQFLAEAPETCFYTCYDLILTTKDGMRYHLIDYIEIGDVTDVAGGGCSLEMFPAFYDERSIRVHVRKFRDLASTAGSFCSHSTSLAADHEMGPTLIQEKEQKDVKEEKAGAEKEDKSSGLPAELENLGNAEPAAGLLKSLLPEIGTEESDCFNSISYSSFNPAPGYRRLQGDLMYFDLVTVEDKAFCITAHTRGFTVNSSTGAVLNPKPAEPKQEASTLVGLLRIISPKFSDAFMAVLDKKASRHPFENMLPPIPPNTWLGVFPLPEHKRNMARAEDALMSPFGTEVTGVQRDWNEELQSCRELPRTTLQDRLMRDRALYRVMCEFVDAATKGAKAVIGRTIPPINPTDPERFHMYVHNSIFFSLAVDGDFAMLQQIREKDLQQQAEAAAKKAEAEANGITAEVETSGKTDENGLKTENKKETASSTLDNGKASADSVRDSTGVEAESSGLSGESKDTDAVSGKEGEEEAQPGAAGETEQATYASANNDLKGTRLINDVDVSGLSTLAMAIVDYRGHRVIAQSIIPGILYGDKTAALKYGSVDNGAHIKWNEKFHSKMSEVAQQLHIKEHSVKDGQGDVVKLCIPVECKGILGSDDRQYVLDLMRLTPRDANFTGPSSRLCVIRPELVASYCLNQEAELWMKANNTEERPSEAKIKELREKKELPVVVFNPNVFTEFTVVGEGKDVEDDEAEVRKLGEYLVQKAIPKVVADFRALEVSPMDGQTLTEVMHAYGVNMRYLGKVAKEAKDLPHIYQLCVTEMVVRSCKHVLKAVLRETLEQDVGGAIAHFINCFIGTSATTLFAATAGSQPASAGSPPPPTGGTAAAQIPAEEKPPTPSSENTTPKGKNKKKGGKQAKDSSEKTENKTEEDKVSESEKKAEAVVFDDRPGYTRITAEMVWSDILEGVKFKYQFELPADVRVIVRQISTLRNLSLKMGIVIAARDFNLDTEAPLHLEDVEDLQAVVKHAAPLCQDAQDLVERGKRLMNEVGLPKRSKLLGAPLLGHWLQQHQGKLNEAYEVFSEAYNLLQQVCGPLHSEVAVCCRNLGMVLYHAGETGAAILQQHRELIINERCLGPDHPDTAHSYGNMALFYHAHEEHELALRHMARTLALLAVTCGSHHPDTAATFINMAMTYQDAGKMPTALRYLQEALKCNERLLGENHIQTAFSYHALALASSAMGAFKLSVQHEKKAYAILELQLGKEDSRTRDSAQWIHSFMRNEVQAQQRKAGHSQTAVRPQSVSAVAEALKQNPELLRALQQAGGPGGASLTPQAMAEALVRVQQAGRFSASPGQPATPTPPPNSAQRPTANAPHAPLPGNMRRGVDERAARAAEVVRRKAAARGVNLRSQAGSKSPAADVEEILNLISQGAGGAAAGGGGGSPGTTGTGAPKSTTGDRAGASTGASASGSGASNSSSGSGRSAGGVHTNSGAGSGPSAGSSAGLGAGLGVGLGALSGAAPPTKGSSSAGRKAGGSGGTAAGSLANGTGSERGEEKKGPIGLGMGLDAPAKKGKPRGRKVAPVGSA